ncbi:MAG: aminotransferase class I/II-fold pyridoxal phosphate-dependent enzyme [Armatimonadetes bacterium]|nr:aminotransferase class I/II-fold pyridoxal phosphate-dependent enzyme [Armatimonadota bacterium]
MSQTIVADLRSDTVTKATPAMRCAMAEAEVGDEIREGDPTAQRLEARAAELTGHEAALFCTSGTMGNLIAFCCHLQRGEEVIAESTSHFLHYESGGIAAIAGAMTRSLLGQAGRVGIDELEAAIRSGTTHNPRTALLVAENTHNYAGGTCLDQAYMKAFCETGRAHGIPVHLDGARVWNAAVALGCPVAELTSGCTSVMVDLSKGLGAPYGSLLCSSADLIARARYYRQRLGGGVRQIGHMAAAGLVAVETMIDRLSEDHANARRLAEGIHALRPECVDLELVQTNMVVVQTAPLGLSGAQLAEALTKKGVLCQATGAHRIRLVTHCDVDAEQIAASLDLLKPLLQI